MNAGLLSEAEQYINWITYFNHDMKAQLYNDDLQHLLKEKKTDYIHFNYLNELTVQDYLNHISYLDISTYLADDLLIMGDRMSMAHSLELRVPFCDHRLMEFCASIPSHLKLEGFSLKTLLKNALSGLLPDKILRKKKQGFMVPVGRWIREDLRGYIAQVLSEDEIEKMGYFNYPFIKQMIEDHVHGRKVFSHQIWALLIMRLWYKMFIENEA